MTVTGLNADLYFSDNPLYVTLDGISPNTRYIEVRVFDLIGIDSRPLKLYNLDSSLDYNLQDFVKYHFDEHPKDTDYTTVTPFVIPNNWKKLTILFTEHYRDNTISTKSITKTFIKGGRRVQGINQAWSVNRILSNSDKLPFWKGYPVSYNYFNSDKQMVKSIVLPSDKREIRNVKGCNPAYICFRNTIGGYSYWLFENWELEDSTKSFGDISTKTSFYDLGSEESETLKLESKVPSRYYALMQDLAVSSEVYLFKNDSGVLQTKTGGTWERIKNKGNKVSFSPFKNNDKVKLNFDLVRKFNPSEIW